MSQVDSKTPARRRSGKEAIASKPLATLAEFVEQATFLFDRQGCIVECEGLDFVRTLIETQPQSGDFVASCFPETIAAPVGELLRMCHNVGDRASRQVLSHIGSEATQARRVYRLTMTVLTSHQRLLTIRDVTCEELARRLKECQHQAAEMMKVLTAREVQVMRMIIRGLPNKAIAIQLQLSIKTIEKYRSGIMRKLGLRSLCDLVRFWFRLAWVEELEAA